MRPAALGWWILTLLLSALPFDELSTGLSDRIALASEKGCGSRGASMASKTPCNAREKTRKFGLPLAEADAGLVGVPSASQAQVKENVR